MSGQSYGSDYEFNKDLTDTSESLSTESERRKSKSPTSLRDTKLTAGFSRSAVRSLNDGHHAWSAFLPLCFITSTRKAC